MSQSAIWVAVSASSRASTRACRGFTGSVSSRTAIKIYAPSDFVADTGWNGRSYPIEDLPDDSEVIYDKMMQNTSHIQANLVAVFQDWFCSPLTDQIGIHVFHLYVLLRFTCSRTCRRVPSGWQSAQSMNGLKSATHTSLIEVPVALEGKLKAANYCVDLVIEKRSVTGTEDIYGYLLIIRHQQGDRTPRRLTYLP